MIARCRLFGRRICCADFYGCQLTLAMRVRYDTHSSLPTLVLTNRFKGSGIRLSQLRWGAPLLYVLAMNLRPALDVTFIEAHRRVRPAVTFACIASIRVTPPPRNSQQTLLAGHFDMTDRVDECELGYWLGKPFWGEGVICRRRPGRHGQCRGSRRPSVRLCRHLHPQYDGVHLKCFGRVLIGVERMLVKTL